MIYDFYIASRLNVVVMEALQVNETWRCNPVELQKTWRGSNHTVEPFTTGAEASMTVWRFELEVKKEYSFCLIYSNLNRDFHDLGKVIKIKLHFKYQSYYHRSHAVSLRRQAIQERYSS